MGAVTRGAARRPPRRRARRCALDAPVERVLVDDGRATRRRCSRTASEVRARGVLSNADPVRTAALAGVDPPPGWRQAGPVVKVMLLLDGLPDFPSWPGRGAVARGDRHRLHARRPRAGAPTTPAPGGRPRAPWIEAACQTAADPTLAPRGPPRRCRCSASASRRTSTPTPRPTPRSPASPRSAPGCPTGSSTAWRSGPRELEERFGITGGHIFHGEMLPGQLFERRPDRRAFGGVEGLYLGGLRRPPGRRRHRRARATSPRRRCSRIWAADEGVFVTRRLPGEALERLAAEHDVERLAEGRLAAARDELRRHGPPRRRACSRCSPTRSTPT